MTQVDLWTLENELRTPDTEPLCGVDEAGRGPLAGPVCAAAVMLPPGLEIPGLNDSKKLSEKKREALYDIIIAQALSYGIAFATVEEIEERNILGATFLAMNRAIANGRIINCDWEIVGNIVAESGNGTIVVWSAPLTIKVRETVNQYPCSSLFAILKHEFLSCLLTLTILTCSKTTCESGLDRTANHYRTIVIVLFEGV